MTDRSKSPLNPRVCRGEKCFNRRRMFSLDDEIFCGCSENCVCVCVCVCVCGGGEVVSVLSIRNIRLDMSCLILSAVLRSHITTVFFLKKRVCEANIIQRSVTAPLSLFSYCLSLSLSCFRITVNLIHHLFLAPNIKTSHHMFYFFPFLPLINTT